jgi:hypothetical protein
MAKVAYMLRLASPAARSTVVRPMPRATMPLLGRQIQRKRVATRCAASPPPMAAMIQGRASTIPTLTAVAIRVMWMQPDVANRLALSRSRAPSACDTRAPMGIISPTLSEMLKNITTVARPTPAVMLGSFSHEM